MKVRLFPWIQASGTAGFPYEGNAGLSFGVFQQEFENEFGPLKSQIIYDKKEKWGRVISIDYQLPKDKRLDDTWGDKGVKALGRLGITAEYNGKSEVRAEQ